MLHSDNFLSIFFNFTTELKKQADFGNKLDVLNS
jgi:hypothetical protein